MSETRKVNFFTRLADDYRASRAYLAARRQIGTIAAQKESAQKDLETACHTLGTKAAELGTAVDLPAAALAAERRRDLAAAQELLRDREAALKTAEDALAAESEKHGRIIGALQDEHRSLLEATRAAKSEVDHIWQQISSLESQIHADEAGIAAAAEGKGTTEPVENLQQKIAGALESRQAYQAQLPAAQDKHAKAATVAAGKAQEVAAAQQTWRDAESKARAEVQAARTARDEAAAAVQSDTAALRAAERELGRALFESTQRPTELETEMGAAQGAATRLANLEAQRTALQARIAETKPSAGRFAILSVIALLVLVAIIVIIVVLTVGGGKKPAKQPEGGAGGSQPASQPVTTAPANPG